MNLDDLPNLTFGSTPRSFSAFQHPSHQLLQEGHYTQQAYIRFRENSLEGMCNLGPYLLSSLCLFSLYGRLVSTSSAETVSRTVEQSSPPILPGHCEKISVKRLIAWVWLGIGVLSFARAVAVRISLQKVLLKYRLSCCFSWLMFVERSRLGIGKSQEMNTLFRFWSFFLRIRFNR